MELVQAELVQCHQQVRDIEKLGISSSVLRAQMVASCHKTLFAIESRLSELPRDVNAAQRARHQV